MFLIFTFMGVDGRGSELGSQFTCRLFIDSWVCHTPALVLIETGDAYSQRGDSGR